MCLYNKIREKTSTLLSNLENFINENSKISIQEMMYVADILKDMSEIAKNLEKAGHYMKDVDESLMKKY